MGVCTSPLSHSSKETVDFLLKKKQNTATAKHFKEYFLIKKAYQDSSGTPEIFNTDQGSQFTSSDFTDVLKKNNIKISMDDKGRWMDNVFIERLWPSATSLNYASLYR